MVELRGIQRFSTKLSSVRNSNVANVYSEKLNSAKVYSANHPSNISAFNVVY